MGSYITYTPDSRVLHFIRIGLIIEVIPHFTRTQQSNGGERIDKKGCVYDEERDGISIPITSMIQLTMLDLE